MTFSENIRQFMNQSLMYNNIETIRSILSLFMS